MKNVKLIMNHFEHMKTFAEIQSHLEMEEGRLKTFSSSNTALFAKGNHLKAIRIGISNTRRHFILLKSLDLRLVLVRSRRQKATARKYGMGEVL